MLNHALIVYFKKKRAKAQQNAISKIKRLQRTRRNKKKRELEHEWLEIERKQLEDERHTLGLRFGAAAASYLHNSYS